MTQVSKITKMVPGNIRAAVEYVFTPFLCFRMLGQMKKFQAAKLTYISNDSSNRRSRWRLLYSRYNNKFVWDGKYGTIFWTRREKNKSTKEKWTKLRGSAKMTFSEMAIIILCYPRKSMFECRGDILKCIIYTLYYKNTSWKPWTFSRTFKILLVWKNPEEHPSQRDVHLKYYLFTVLNFVV